MLIQTSVVLLVFSTDKLATKIIANQINESLANTREIVAP